MATALFTDVEQTCFDHVILIKILKTNTIVQALILLTIMMFPKNSSIFELTPFTKW